MSQQTPSGLCSTHRFNEPFDLTCRVCFPSANPVLSAERLEEIRTLRAGITPGPWRWEDWDGAPPRDEIEHRNTLAAPPDARPRGPSAWYPDLGQKVISGDFLECTPADKAFIASAPQIADDCLALAEENARLQAELARFRGDAERLTAERDSWQNIAEMREQHGIEEAQLKARVEERCAQLEQQNRALRDDLSYAEANASRANRKIRDHKNWGREL